MVANDFLSASLYDIILDTVVRDAIVENKFSELTDANRKELIAIEWNYERILVKTVHELLRHEIATPMLEIAHSNA